MMAVVGSNASVVPVYRKVVQDRTMPTAMASQIATRQHSIERVDVNKNEVCI